MLEVDLPLLDQVLVNVLRVLRRTLQPARDGAFIQAKGGYNRLGRTAMCEQGQDNRDQIDGQMQAIERGAAGGGEGRATHLAAIALLLLAMDGNVALPDLPPCTTVQVMAELDHRVHVGAPRNERWKPRRVECQMNSIFSSA